MAFTFVQLETFYWVARLGSFSAAARHLNATQPAVSARIRQLEQALGTPVLERSQRGAELTAKGQLLFCEAEDLIRQFGRIRYDLADRELIGGKIRIGVAELIAVTWLAALVSRLNEQYPKLQIELDVDLTLSLSEKLAAGALDIALLPGPIADSRLQISSIGKVRFEWMASPTLGIPSTELSPDQLTQWPIITLSSQSNLHKVLEEWFARAGAELQRLDVCNSLSVVTEMVAAGIGVSYLSLTQAKGLIEAGKLQVIRTHPPLAQLEYFAAYPRKSTVPLAENVAKLAVQASTFAF